MKKSGVVIYELNERSSKTEENLFDFSLNPAENINLNFSTRSPLRYPGGKTRGVEFITQFFPKKP